MKLHLIQAHNYSQFDHLYRMNIFNKALLSVAKKILKLNSSGLGAIFPSITLPTLAAITPADWEITAVDEQVESTDFNINTDLVAISFNTRGALRAYYIADRFRRRGIRVILGGIHTTLVPEEASQHADAICIGEAESYWHELLNDVKNGRLKKRYISKHPPSLLNAPRPNNSILKEELYFPVYPLQTSRGCPFSCQFCAVHKIFGHKIRTKKISAIEEEIASIKQNFIYFTDENIGVNTQHLNNIINVLQGSGKYWLAQANVSIGKDEKTLKRMYDAGCRVLLTGIESLSERTIKNFASNKNRTQSLTETIRRIENTGITVIGGFILGFDEDTQKTAEEILKFCEKSNLTFPVFNVLVPYPGTEICNLFSANNRLIHTDWEEYGNSRVVFEPKYFTSAELEKVAIELWKKSYNLRNIFKNSIRHFKWSPMIFASGITINFATKKLINDFAKVNILQN